MEKPEVDKGTCPEDVGQLNRNRSFKSKQLVRSQAIRESQSPPRTVSPAVELAITTANGDTATDSSQPSDACTQAISYTGQISDNSDDFKKKLPVEIQITSGGWDEGPTDQRQRTKRWLGQRNHSDSSRDLLSNNPRVACVCGSCAACPHCRGRRRQLCSTKQDSGIECSDDCLDCPEYEQGVPNDGIRKTSSLDVEEYTYFCRCPEKKEKPKSVSLSRTDSDENSEPTGVDLVKFIKETLNKNARDRMTLLRIEKELHALVNDTGRCVVRFPVMSSYGRMLVHRCAALFHLAHHLDLTTKTCVLVSKTGTSGGRIPCTSFKQWCITTFPPSPQRHVSENTLAKSILKRDTASLEDGAGGALANSRSRSLEQRERDYERVRRRIFSTENCSPDESQWPWLNSGPVKVLTPETGRNKLLKVQSLEGASVSWRGRGAVSKSHSFGGYEPPPAQQTPRLLSRQGDLASSSWRLSPSSSGYKTLSLRSTDSVTPSPTGGASPELGGGAPERLVCCVTDLSAVPVGALVIHPQTGRPLTNPDGSIYHFDPNNPPTLYDANAAYDTQTDIEKADEANEKKRGKLEKQNSFIDTDIGGECECQSTGECRECRNKCCCECRRNNSQTSQQKESNPKPASPCENRYEQPTVPTTESTNHRPPFNTSNEQKPEPTNQRPAYEPPPNQKHDYEAKSEQRTYVSANQRNENQKSVESTNQALPSNKEANENQELQYAQPYVQQGYRNDEVTSPQQVIHHTYVQNMVPQKLTAPPLATDHNIRPMSLTNVVYPNVAQPYPYINQCRLDQPLQPTLPVYQPVITEEQKPMMPHDTGFRIDPSYPYAAVDYTGCGACAEPAQLAQRSVNLGYSQMDVSAPPPAYPIHNMVIPQPPMQPYPYQESCQWGGMQVAGGPKVVGEVFPLLPYAPYYTYPAYNLLYPTPPVLQQPYPVCQPIYPMIDKPEGRSASADPAHVKRGSLSTPRTPDDKPEDERRDSTEIALKIQQIKDQMAQLNTRDRFRRNDDWKRRNSGTGILGSYPVNNFNGRVVGPPNDETQLTSAARAIVNSIRNMQAKNTYQQDRRPEFREQRGDRGESRRSRPDRDDNRSDRAVADRRHLPLYRPPYLLRQMSPGTWCRRSPGPVHPVFNHPRRPHPDTRNARR